MTLNAIIYRLKQITLAHKQLRNFYYGITGDEDTDKTLRYPSAFLFDSPGSYEVSGKTLTVGFKLDLCDLVHVSEKSKQNEQDVISDMLSIAGDLLAELNHSSYTDWKVSLSNTIDTFRENRGDMVAGVTLSFSVSVPYGLDTCAVPTELVDIINQEDMKLVYDEKYIATGSEGVTLNMPAIVGKKVLFVTRESAPIYKVSSSPGASEYVWDETSITLGAPVGIVGERFLILYRNY